MYILCIYVLCILAIPNKESNTIDFIDTEITWREVHIAVGLCLGFRIPPKINIQIGHNSDLSLNLIQEPHLAPPGWRKLAGIPDFSVSNSSGSSSGVSIVGSDVYERAVIERLTADLPENEEALGKCVLVY